MTGRVVVVGLGPAGVDLLLPAARRALEHASHRFVRTMRHPAVDELAAAGVTFESFDRLYDAAVSIDDVYPEIVTTLVAMSLERGEIAYAVPGNPPVAERSVALLHVAAAAGEIELTIIPGLSFADLAWARLGIDPMSTGARVVDGRDLAPDRIGNAPLLIGQCDTTLVLSDVKLALLERLDPVTPITVLQRLGLPEECCTDVTLAELDRVVEADHLTALFVPADPAAPTDEVVRLLALARRLRGPGGCPWDAEQTHHSLTRYLLEESYEVVEAVEHLPAAAPTDTDADDPAYALLVDELGDLLYQVVFHVVLAEERGAFDLDDVARGIHDKLVRRHPHVFGDVEAGTSAAVMRNWEQIKKEEKGTDSIMAGITPGLPSLLYAHKLLRKAASVGIDPGDLAASLDRIDAGTAALRTNGGDRERAFGDLLAATVVLARELGIDAESALRGWAARYKAHFEAMEAEARRRGLDLHTLAPDEVGRLWAATDH